MRIHGRVDLAHVLPKQTNRLDAGGQIRYTRVREIIVEPKSRLPCLNQALSNIARVSRHHLPSLPVVQLVEQLATVGHRAAGGHHSLADHIPQPRLVRRRRDKQTGSVARLAQPTGLDMRKRNLARQLPM